MLVLTSRMCAGLDAVGESNVRYAALFYMVAIEREEEEERERAGQKGGGGGGDELWIQHLPAHRHTLIQEFRASPGSEWFYPLNTVNQILFWSQRIFDYPEIPAAQCTAPAKQVVVRPPPARRLL